MGKRIGQVVDLVAEATGLEVGTVKIGARYLREAGDVSSSNARGLSGVILTPKDVARIMLGAMSTHSVSQWVEGARGLGALRCELQDDPECLQALTEAGLPCSSGETLEEALTAVLTPNAEVHPEIEIIARHSPGGGGALSAECRLGTANVHFSSITKAEWRRAVQATSALSERLKTPEGAASFKAKQEEERAATVVYRPRRFSDRRSITCETLIWLRSQIFEDGSHIPKTIKRGRIKEGGGFEIVRVPNGAAARGEA